MDSYIKLVERRISQITETQGKKIQAAGNEMARSIERDQLIYVFGAGGHTSLVVGEMFFRIGGLANIYPIVEYGISALSQARKFIALERAKGLGGALIEASGIGNGDLLLLFHTIGVNATCIDAAKKAKSLGAKVIGVASKQWQDETPSDALIRAEGKENLCDIVDIYIDDCNTVDDAELLLGDMNVKVGPLSGIGTFVIAHLLEISAMTRCLEMGIKPPVWANANTPEGEAQNEALMEKYAARIPML